MSALEDRIAAILREHRRGDDTHDPFRDRYVWSCLGCTKLFRDDDHLESHTSALIAALFDEETALRVTFPNGNSIVLTDPVDIRAARKIHVDRFDDVARWVSDWEPQ